MLYTSWRNEKKDILKDFKTDQDRFETVKNQIEQNSKNYENNSEVIDSAVEQIEVKNQILLSPLMHNVKMTEREKSVRRKLNYLDASIQAKISNILSTI